MVPGTRSGPGGRNGSGYFRFGVGCPGTIGWTTCGVTTITSSFLLRFKLLLVNSFPRIGISPMPGIFCICSVTRLSIKPAIAKLCPSVKLMSDSTRLVASAGITNPCSVKAFVKSSELTSGLTFR